MSKEAQKEIEEWLDDPNLNPGTRFLLEQYQKVESGKGGPEYVDAPKSQIAEYLLRLAFEVESAEQGDIVRGRFVPSLAVSISRDLLDKLLELAWERGEEIEASYEDTPEDEWNQEEWVAIVDCLLTTENLLYPEEE